MTPVPFQLGRYQIEEQLAEGGMGEAYRATQVGPDGFTKTVVVKLIRPMHRPRAGHMERFVERFRDEARIHSHLDHGNIVHLLDFGVHEGRHFIVLEYVHGLDLRELQRYAALKGELLPHAWVEHIIDRLCRALQVAHMLTVGGVAQHLVHRDISLSNVLVSADGEVKLTDFGIAKAALKEYRTVSGEVPGKLEYMSPEQVLGEAVDRRSDLFSLGVVLYVLLTGRMPFGYSRDVGHDTLMKRITSGTYQPPETLVPTIPGRLSELVASLLQVDPNQRPASAAEIATRLEVKASADLEIGQFVREAIGDTHEATGKLASPEAETRSAPATAGVQLDNGVAPDPRDTSHSLQAGDARNDARSEPDSAAVATRRARVVLLVTALLIIAASAAWLGLTAFPRVPSASQAPSVLPDVAVEPAQTVQPKPERVAPAVPIVIRPQPSTRHESVQPPEDAVRSREVVAKDAAYVEAPAEAAEPASTEGTLRVFVAPTGTIWVDGRVVGADRLTIELPAGRHVVEAGRNAPETRKVVHVKAGDTKTLQMVIPYR